MITMLLCALIIWLLGMLVGMIIETIMRNASVAQNENEKVTGDACEQLTPAENYFEDF